MSHAPCPPAAHPESASSEPDAREPRAEHALHAAGLSVPAHESFQAAPTASPAPNPASNPTGDARYERRLVLGEGGMGRVTLVHDRLLGRDVALKEPVPGHAGDGLHLEASLTARLEHPAVVPVYDAHQTADGRFAYTMRLLRGRSLDRVLADPGLDAASRRGLLRHILVASQAVAWAHAHGVVHRDLKPSNIMVGEFGETQVVDWGLAQSLSAEGHRHGVAGTPYYMSPEQAAGRPADARSDVYALGLVLYEVATGRRGRPGEGTDQAMVSARAGLGPVRDDALPGDLWAVIQRATATAPAERYPDAKAFAADLAAWLDGRRVSVHEYSPFELLSRLVAAWRVPLMVAAVALVIGGVAVGLSLTEASSQRDLARAQREVAESARAAANKARREAEAELARSLVFSAGSRLDAGQPFEALATVLDALELLEANDADTETLADARGIVLSAASTPAARIVDVALLPPHDRWVPGETPGSGLAVAGDRLSWWDLPNTEPRWSVSVSELLGAPDQAIEWAATLSTHVVVGAGGEMPFAIDRDTGVLIGTLTLPIRGRVATHGDDLLIIGWDSMTLMAGATLSQWVLADCREQVGAFDEAHLLGICRDGRFSRWHRQPDHVLMFEAEQVLQSTGTEPSSVALRPTSEDFVVGTTRGELLVAELATGVIRARLEVGVGVVSQVDVSPDGRFAALIDEREGVALVDLTTRTLLGRLPASVSSGFRFAAGPTLLTWGSERQILWAFDVLGPRVLDAGRGVTAVGWGDGMGAFTASGRQALHGVDGAAIETFDTSHVVKGLALLPLAKTCRDAAGPAHLATAGVGFRLRLSGPAPFETLLEPRPTVAEPMVRRLAAVRTTARGPCEWMALAMTDYGGLLLIDSSGVTLWERDGEVRGLDLASSGDGRLAIASLGAAMEPFAITLDPHPMARPIPAIRGCTAVAVAPSGEELFACAQEREIVIADLEGNLFAWLPFGRLLERSRRGPTNEHLTELSWSPDGRLLAVGTRLGRTQIWAAPSRGHRSHLLATLSDHRERVAAIAWDSSRRWLSTGSWDRMIRPRDLDLLGPTAAALRDHLFDLLAHGEIR